MHACGIYSITHLSSDKRYIGSSLNIKRRLLQHKSKLNLGNHYNGYLQYAWNKYGANNFLLHPLLICSPEDLVFYEQLVIDGYKSCNTKNGYNLLPKVGTRFGYKEQTIQRVKRLSIKYGLKIDPNNPERIIPSNKKTKKSLTEKQISQYKKLKENTYKKIITNNLIRLRRIGELL